MYTLRSAWHPAAARSKLRHQQRLIEHMTTAIQTELGYLIPSKEKPVYFASQGGAEAELHIGAQIEARTVTIADAREKHPAPTLDKEGFTLVDHVSAVTDFYDDARIHDIYEREVAALVKQVTGASRVSAVVVYVYDAKGLVVAGAQSRDSYGAVVHAIGGSLDRRFTSRD